MSRKQKQQLVAMQQYKIPVSASLEKLLNNITDTNDNSINSFTSKKYIKKYAKDVFVNFVRLNFITHNEYAITGFGSAGLTHKKSYISIIYSSKFLQDLNKINKTTQDMGVKFKIDLLYHAFMKQLIKDFPVLAYNIRKIIEKKRLILTPELEMPVTYGQAIHDFFSFMYNVMPNIYKQYGHELLHLRIKFSK